jgi:iron(II)-dependent oxidoreductase
MPDNKKREFETPKVLHDAPLRADDAAYFHFDDFARTLARLIATKETRTPLTIGVSGPWGSGKTTLLKRTRKMLDATINLEDKTRRPSLDFSSDADQPLMDRFRVCRTVWFDAWKYAEEDELLVALIRVILNTMAAGDLSGKFWGKVLDPQHPRYDVLATFLNTFKFKFGGVEIGVDLGKYKTETEFKLHTAFSDFFDKALEALLARWVHGTSDFDKIDERRGVMAVFIDDLDRCLPAKTVQVLEAIKLFLDKPGCVFVLGADKDVVCEAVTSHYKNAGVTGESASDYLEKIIQLRFELPLIMDEEMGKYLGEAGDTIDEQVRNNWQTIVVGAEINPRKVKTFVNDLNLRWAMLRNSGQAEGVNRDDFTRWHVLARAAPAGFIQQAQDLPADMRSKFIADAIKWARGDASVAGSFKAYEASRRLQRVLKMIEFSDQFTDKALDAFVHLTALPQPPPSEPRPTESSVWKAEAQMADKRIFADILAREGEAIAPGAVQRFGGIEFVRVPKGKFVMGSKDDNPLAFDDEKPQHIVEIPYDYWLARYLVTNNQFATFIEATKYVTTAEKEGGWSPVESKFVKGCDWRHPLDPKNSLKDKGDHHVVQVSWYDAMEYAQWLNQELRTEIGDLEIRLPTEAEWEKAARGEYGNEWPWGNEFDPAKCNSSEGSKGTTTPVGSYSPQGDSPYGAADMVGNVWEWTQSLWGIDSRKPDFKYPYDSKDGRENQAAGKDVLRVLRGGSWTYPPRNARAACRGWHAPDSRDYGVGFRLVAAPALP